MKFNNGSFVLGMVLCVVLVPLCVLAWFRFGRPPVAVADAPFPMEEMLVKIPLHARIAAEQPKSVPLSVDEGNLVAGAEIYRDNCAACHGYHGKPSRFASRMFPPTPQLWEKHGKDDVVGVSDDPPAETYWKVANGIRLTGMPAYKGVLTDREIWQVTLLLANADKPLPPGALAILLPSQQQSNAEPIAPAKP
jgi:mono/diheme cytochrome c family protein